MRAPVGLVLGGRGLLGQALVHALTEEGWDVRCLEREAVNLGDPGGLTREVEAIEPAALFNTMAWTQVDKAESQPEEAMLINRGLPALLGRIVKGSSTHLVHYSSDYVFNGRKKTPYLPDDPTDPLSVYGRTKLAGEQALRELDLPNCAVVRSAWLFGPGKGNFVATILRLAKTRDELTVVHDQTGSPTYTPDLAKASVLLATQRIGGLLHVVNSGQASWCELAAEAVRLANLPVRVLGIPSSQWPQEAPRPAFSVLDASLYTTLTGKPLRPWVQALREYIYTSHLAR